MLCLPSVSPTRSNVRLLSSTTIYLAIYFTRWDRQFSSPTRLGMLDQPLKRYV